MTTLAILLPSGCLTANLFVFDKLFESIVGGLIGSLAALLWASLRHQHNRAKIQLRQFEDVLDVSVTHFADGMMEIRTQLEQELSEALPGNKNQVMVAWVKEVAGKTRFDNVLLSSWQGDSQLVYDALRNRIYGRLVNVLDYASRRELGEPFTMVRFLGMLTCEPRFRTRDQDSGKVVWIEVIEEKGKEAETKQKIRLLLFTEKSIDDLLRWSELQARAEGLEPEQVLAQLCAEKHVILRGTTLPPRVDRPDTFTFAGKGRIDQLIAHIGMPSRPVDRKRLVAMAQVARAIKYRGENHLWFDIPVPRQTAIPVQAPLCEDLTARGGQYFPCQPREAEKQSLESLSFTRRSSTPPHGLFYLGRNGTATALATRDGEILLIRKPLHGQTSWALPGGFLTKPSLLEELVRELCEEAIEAEPGDPVYEGLLRKARESAELIYLGPVRDSRDEAEAWIVDHVYHLDCSGMDLRLRRSGVRDLAEEISGAQWVPLTQALAATLFASHGTMVRAWMAEQFRRLDAGRASTLRGLEAGALADLRRRWED